MRELYLGVGTISEPHSGVWKFWTQGDEFYAAQVIGMGRVAKFSVHASGICRFAFVADYDYAWDGDNDPRVIQRWTVPAVGSVPWCSCFLLVVPSAFIPERSDLTARLKAKYQTTTVWVEAAPLRQSVNVECVRIENPDTNLHDVVAGDYKVLGSLDLRSGAVIWVFAYIESMTAKDSAEWQRRVAESIFTLDQDEPGGAFGTLASPSGYPTPLVREMALGKSNFRVVRPTLEPRTRRGRRRR